MKRFAEEIPPFAQKHHRGDNPCKEKKYKPGCTEKDIKARC